MTALPEPGIYCVEADCPKLAMTDRPIGVCRDGLLIVELVCDDHAHEPECPPRRATGRGAGPRR